jgi:predicted aldo/keto reductase-like oxidoreductase
VKTELEMAGQFLKKGFTDAQAKLKAVWENPHIASICSQMPSMTILMSNVAAALNQTKLSAEDMSVLEKYAQETSSSYCAGCTHICQSIVPKEVRIHDVMRCLMYYHGYGEPNLARALFAQLPQETRRHLVDLDFSLAEQRCPQGLPIGRLMKEAETTLI